MSLSKFHHPFEPMGHPQLEPEVKHAILASWASHAHPGENRPDPGRLPGASDPRRVADKMPAMRGLDAREV